MFSGDESDIQNTVIDGYSEGTAVTFDLNGNTTETITGFTIQNADYGVRCLDYSHAEISHNIISGCAGTGIRCFSISRVAITGNKIANNQGSGISTSSDSVTINENLIADNSGSGIHCSGSDAQIIHNVVIGNADYGISCYTAHPLILRNTVSRNGQTYSGAGIYCRNSLPALEYNVIAFNVGWHGAVYCYQAPAKALRVLNCNIYGNRRDWVDDIYRHRLLYGNFSADPMFCDTANGDYHINAYSPCAPGVEPNVESVGALGVGCGYVRCGDSDGNGAVDDADLQRVLDSYYGVGDVWPFPVSAGDLDCDGVITIADIVLLAGYIHGYGPLPCCAPPPKRIDLPGREADTGPGN